MYVGLVCICNFLVVFVCSYIYCEIVSINVETAASLMYAANKYMLPKLVRECGKCLSEGLSVNNVIQVLKQSSLFNEDGLKSKCLELIVQNPNAVFTGTEIISASPHTIETLLEIDRIPIKEIVVYETCLAWARHQILIQLSTENPTDQQIREMLGDLLFKIRFPTMQGTEFAEISEDNNVLTGEEKASIFYFLMTKKKSSHLMFPTERRFGGEELWIERTVTCVSEQWYSPAVDAINFETNQDMSLTGIGLYTGYNGASYDVDVEILQSIKCLFKKKITVPSAGEEHQFKVSMNEPISIQAGVVYSVKALSNDNIGHYGGTCQAVCTKGNVTVTFSKNQQSPHTSPTYGHIPRLYFRTGNLVQND